MKANELFETRALGQGMSKAALAADTEQSDREYIAGRQKKQRYQKWINDCRKSFPNATVTGDIHQAQMVDWSSKNNEVAGDWDGANGVVYVPGSMGKKIAESTITGTEKHVRKMGLDMGRKGKTPLSKSSVDKAFGGYYDEYMQSYNKGKAEFTAADDHEAWREKRQDALQGRHYHESLDAVQEMHGGRTISFADPDREPGAVEREAAARDKADQYQLESNKIAHKIAAKLGGKTRDIPSRDHYSPPKTYIEGIKFETNSGLKVTANVSENPFTRTMSLQFYPSPIPRTSESRAILKHIADDHGKKLYDTDFGSSAKETYQWIDIGMLNENSEALINALIKAVKKFNAVKK